MTYANINNGRFDICIVLVVCTDLSDKQQYNQVGVDSVISVIASPGLGYISLFPHNFLLSLLTIYIVLLIIHQTKLTGRGG